MHMLCHTLYYATILPPCSCLFMFTHPDYYEIKMVRPPLSERKRKYDEFRRTTSRKGITFLTQQERAKRLCVTEDQANVFLNGLISLADQRLQTGESMILVMDIECDLVKSTTKSRRPSDQFYWFRELLNAQGQSKETIQDRETRQKGFIRKNRWRRYTPVEKVRYYWLNNVRSQIQGMLHSSCHTIQLAAVDDEPGNLTFAIHTARLINQDYKGEIKMPPLLLNLLTHPAVIFCNVNQFDDIASIINSFWEGMEVRRIKYIEAEDFFLHQWGYECPNKEGRRLSTTGVLNIFMTPSRISHGLRTRR